MTNVPEQESDAITRMDRPSRLGDGREGTCDGCRELAARVERLERAIAIRGDAIDPDALSTTRCYWICIAVHAMCALLMYSSAALISYGMMISIGAIATLVVCQVFSTRPVHHRMLRSLLSVSVVASAALLGSWIGDIAGPGDVIPYLVMLFPPVFASSWIVAKSFLWFGGWRIVPPDYTTQYARLQIQHLLLATLLIAAYLAVGRTLATEIDDWLSDDVVVTIVYLIIPTMICTVISCLLARIVLSAPATRVVSRCFVVAIISVMFMEVAFAAVASAAGGMMVDWETMTGVSVYAILLSVGVIASSGGTFGMMRVANYRFHSR